MPRKVFMFFVLLVLSPPLFAANLVTDGRAHAKIVIATQPARMTRLAAEELQTYVQKISGARLVVEERTPAQDY